MRKTMRDLKVGQRWLYNYACYRRIEEIVVIFPNYAKVKVVQCLTPDDCTKLGTIYDEHSFDYPIWTYLEGQDAPLT